jgi:hypothetical protein
VYRPDGSHDKLPQRQSEAIERVLARDFPGVKVRPDRRPNVLVVAVVVAVVELVIVAGLFWAFVAMHPASAPPYVVVNTPATYGAPGPAGGPR